MYGGLILRENWGGLGGEGRGDGVGVTGPGLSGGMSSVLAINSPRDLTSKLEALPGSGLPLLSFNWSSLRQLVSLAWNIFSLFIASSIFFSAYTTSFSPATSLSMLSLSGTVIFFLFRFHIIIFF